jgi:Ras-related GTP-binding protein A/B
MARKKVLLMGKAHSGKTSMRSIIFANYLARDTMRLSPTLDVEHHHVRFLGDLVLNLWDCGGQDAFYESYFERDRETIFKSVELLIYVFDIASECPEKDFDHFAGVLEAIEENSPDARIFVLVHKMDLVAKEEQEMILEDRRRLIEESCNSCGVQNFQCFGTSIWDETLYKAWSEIVRYLIPNIGVLQSHLDAFCKVCDADEVVLFEKATFLVISHSTAGSGDPSSSASAVVLGSGTGTGTEAASSANGNESLAVLEDVHGGSLATTASSRQQLQQQPHEGKYDLEMNSNGVVGVEDQHDHTKTNVSIPGQDTVMATHEHDAIYSDAITDKDQTMVMKTTTAAATTKEGAVAIGVGNLAMSSPTDANKQMASTVATTTSTMAVQSQQSQSHHHHHHQQQQPPPPSSSPGHFDTHRFEKISNIVKQFKLSCEKAQSQFQGMEVSNSKFSAFIDAFTVNTYIMVIVSRKVHTAATLTNIKNARRHFERLIPRS